MNKNIKAIFHNELDTEIFDNDFYTIFLNRIFDLLKNNEVKN